MAKAKAEKRIKSSSKKSAKKHGFLARNQSASGRKVLKQRRAKGRHSV